MDIISYSSILFGLCVVANIIDPNAYMLPTYYFWNCMNNKSTAELAPPTLSNAIFSILNVF